nr:hypothetical protein [uncultured Pseudomonas sp.]
MKILLLPLLLLAGFLTSVAQGDDVEGLTTIEQERELSGRQMELERERGDAAAEHFGEELEGELRDAPPLDPGGNSMDIDPLPPQISPGSPTIAPTPSPVPAPRLPGESERDRLIPGSGN